MAKKAEFRFPAVGFRFPIERPHPSKGEKVEFQFPIKGIDTNKPIEKQPLLTSPDLENVRPYDQLEKRLRGGQRPGCRKWGAGSRIGGGDYRIDKLVQIGVGTSEWAEDNQMTWLLVPYVYSCGSISMAATVLDAYYGVEYEFDCTTDDTYDSGWQDSNVHTITGLTSETPLTFRCRAREKSPGIKVTEWSSSESVTPNAKPQPDPLTWATEPYADCNNQIIMVATTATDPSGVEYYFTCESGAGGSDRDWGDSASYTDTGLTAGTEYCYSVKARDKSGLQCEGAKSATKCAIANAKPQPNPMTWATEPYASSPGEITMVATTATDPSGVEYYFTCESGAGGSDRNWADSASYTDTGLTPSVEYCYSVKARDKSGLQCENAKSATRCVVAAPELPGLGSGETANIWKTVDNGSGLGVVWVYDTGGAYVLAVTVDDSGNVYAVSARTSNLSVWKLNSAGVKQWDYDTGATARGVAVDGSGNVYVAGNNPVEKLDSSGNQVWTYDTTATARGIAVDSSGNVYVAGNRSSVSVWKLNSAGGLVWSYDTGNSTYSITVDDDGNVYVGGVDSTDEDGNLGSIRKLNSSGVLQWFYNTGDTVNGIAIDSSGNVYAAADRSGNLSVWKLNSSGVKQWDYDTGTTARDIAVDGSGNVYVAVWSSGSTSIRKLDSDGNLVWSDSTGGIPYGIDIDSSNIYLGGDRITG